MDIKYIIWALFQIFNFHKSGQEKLELNWFWKVDVPDWWMDTKLFDAYCYIMSFFVKNNDDDDGYPF